MRRLVAFTLVLCALLTVHGGASGIAAPIGAPVVFRPAGDTTLFLHGRGLFHGTLEARRGNSGLLVVNDLDLDDYVAGILEVPGRWPMEALKAQAVAARTYALWEKQTGHWKKFGYDVCATTACQVYSGADVERGTAGRRWVQAVHETAGQVLLYKGHPALTRFHSSSGGHTLPNEALFSEGAVPYLRGVDDPTDNVSPLHRWNVVLTRAQLEQILRVGIGLGGKLVDVQADVDGKQVRIRTGGGQLDIGPRRFTTVVNNKASRMFPSSFPGLRSDGLRMPFTMPSSRFSVERTATGFVVHGRGYGHGVGMSQYGAKGLADNGKDYKEILETYYTGLRPSRWHGSRSMRVAVSQGESSVAVSGNGTFGVYTGEDALSPSTIGVWSVSNLGVHSLAVSHPAGYSLPLVLSGLRAPGSLYVDPPKQGGALDVDFVVPKAAEVTGILRRGAKVVARGRTVVEAGEGRVDLTIDPHGLPQRATYRLELTAFDGKSRVVKTADVVLTRPARSLLPMSAIVALVALGFLVLIARRRRRRVVQSPTIPERGQLSPEPHG
jgi:SpoIID/LytB domain protein